VKGEKKETDVSHIHGICPGDRCIFRGRLDLPRESTNPGGYDRRSSLRAKGIKYEMKADFVERCDGGMRGEHFTEVSDSGAGAEHFTIIGWMRKFAYRLRVRLGESLEKYMSKEKAGILKAMMLGDKDDLDENTKLLYQKSGIAHVLAISGLHVALVAGMIEFLLGMMGISKKKA
jgi:competence protein ComEC